MSISGKNIRQLQSAMKKGDITSRQLCVYYLDRIAHIDKCENGLNSIAEINPDAIDIAERLDRERSEGNARGPMHGIPVILKDNINTADKMHTTAGSMALMDNFAPYDAGIVENLREAGAVILGKANMTELANAMAKGMPGGYSSRGGQVLHPYDRKLNPSGSSAGSAVAVAAGLCPVSVGTETSGSIICPSWVNGIVGIKPTKNLLPGNGIIPISHTLDTAGPMASSVHDAALLLEALADGNESYAFGLGSSDLESTRIGINKADLNAFSKPRADRFERLLLQLKTAGAELIDIADMPHARELGSIMLFEYKSSMNHYLSTLSSKCRIRNFDDIISFNKANKVKALVYGQSYLLKTKYFTSGTLTEEKYLKALVVREVKIAELDKTMDENELDIIIHANIYNNLSAFTGFPSMTIPAGFDEKGIPEGILMTARRFDERRLISAAYGIEKALDIKMYPPGYFQ